MNKPILVALLLASAVAGCSRPPESFTARDDVSMRVVPAGKCDDCTAVDYLQAGRNPTTIRVGDVVVRSGDIDFFVRSYEHGGELQFTYKEDAQPRILHTTSYKEGSAIALMVGDRAVGISRISKPFWKESEIGGLTPFEMDYIVSQIALRTRSQ